MLLKSLPRSLTGWSSLAVVGVTLGLGTATIGISNGVAERWDAAQQSGRNSAGWLAIRADHDFSALQASVAEAVLPGSGVKGPDVTNWIDVLHVQASDLRSMPVQGAVRDHVVRLADDIDRALAATGPLLPRVDDPAVALKVIGILRRIDHRIANAAVSANADAEDAQRREQRVLLDMHDRFKLFVEGLIASSAVLVGLLVRHCTLLGRSARRSTRLAEGLEEANHEATRQAGLFDAALSNMGQALCMTSPQGRVIVFNCKLVDMLAPGHTIEPDVLVSGIPALVPGTRLAMLAPMMEAASPGTAVVTLADETSVSVTCSPTSDGGRVFTFEDVTDRCRTEERVAFLAHHDELTGLVNRRRITQLMDEALLTREGLGLSTAVLAVDLDGFKDVNDTYGHPVGDAVLREVSRRMLDQVGPDDVVARLGGDEFVVLHPLSPGDDGSNLAARLIAAVKEPIVTAAVRVGVGASVGVARAPRDGIAAGDLMKSADVALYHAKQDGRGMMCFYDVDADEQRRERRTLVHDLRGVVDRGELTLHYQPIVCSGTDRVLLYEALVRWRHPVRGLVPPTEFIPLAEDTGDIVAIGEWVIREACRTALTWPDHVGVAVNLSAVQFASANVVAMVASALADSGLPPSRLEVEVTEGVLLKDFDETLRILEALKAIGVRIAMDDFGTGYASLSYLQRFPFDKIKIDRSFVDGMTKGDCSNHIVASMTNLARSLNLVTCAEGVETRGQADALAGMGCKQLQGYYFGRPEPVARIPDAADGESAAMPVAA